MVRMIVVVASSLAVLIGSAAAQGKQVTDDQYAELQQNFAEAYNRKDADAMAAAFAEDGIRVTPSGIFRDRDAIHHNLQDVLNMDCTTTRFSALYLVPLGPLCSMLESGKRS
jgi:ketosteroid isomerase-like protein